MWQKDDKIENLTSCMLDYKTEMDLVKLCESAISNI